MSVRLNLGCGPKAFEGYVNVDIKSLPSVDIILNLNNAPWQFKDNYFDEIMADNILEHMDDPEQFIRECHRILDVGGKLVVIVPHWHHLGAHCEFDHKTTFGIELMNRVFERKDLGNWKKIKLELVPDRIGRFVPKRLLPFLSNIFGGLSKSIYLEATKEGVSGNDA